MIIKSNTLVNGQQFLSALGAKNMSAHWSNPLWEDFSYNDLIDEEEPPIDPEFDDLAGGLK